MQTLKPKIIRSDAKKWTKLTRDTDVARIGSRVELVEFNVPFDI